MRKQLNNLGTYTMGTRKRSKRAAPAPSWKCNLCEEYVIWDGITTAYDFLVQPFWAKGLAEHLASEHKLIYIADDLVELHRKRKLNEALIQAATERAFRKRGADGGGGIGGVGIGGELRHIVRVEPVETSKRLLAIKVTHGKVLYVGHGKARAALKTPAINEAVLKRFDKLREKHPDDGRLILSGSSYVDDLYVIGDERDPMGKLPETWARSMGAKHLKFMIRGLDCYVGFDSSRAPDVCDWRQLIGATFEAGRLNPFSFVYG